MSPRASSDASVPPEFLPIYHATVAQWDAWADRVVAAWLRRRTATFTWRDDAFWLVFDVTTAGRSIFIGDSANCECLVTRARDGFVAVVNGKRYRDLWLKIPRNLLEGALKRTSVPGFSVAPPFAWSFVTEEDLDRWYAGARSWSVLSDEARVDRYLDLAADLVDALLDYTDQFRHFDGYLLAEADRSHIAIGPECIAFHPHGTNDILLSGRRYPRGGLTRPIRDAVRIVLTHNAIPFREFTPEGRGYFHPSAFFNAWEATRMRLVADGE